MDTPSASPGLFSYLQHQPPAGNTPFHAAAKFLRLLGLVTIAYAGVSVLSALIQISFASEWGVFGAAVAGSAIFGLIVSLAIAGAFSFWISYTYFHWCRRTANGWNHAQYLGITIAILAGLGALSGLVGLAGLSFYWAVGGFGALYGILVLLSLAVSVAEVALAVLVLTNRGKSHAAFGLQGPAPMPPMSPQ